MASLGHRKGSIKEGYDADFVIWDPDASYTVCMTAPKTFLYCLNFKIMLTYNL